MANLMPEIARMLGVELGEEFKVVSKDGSERTCILTHNGLLDKDTNYVYYNKELFVDIVRGDAEVIKLPWKPKKGETYYTFELLGSKWVVRPSWCGGFPNEYALFEKGWVYRTRTEAEAALPTVAKEMGVEYEL